MELIGFIIIVILSVIVEQLMDLHKQNKHLIAQIKWEDYKKKNNII